MVRRRLHFRSEFREACFMLGVFLRWWYTFSKILEAQCLFSRSYKFNWRLIYHTRRCWVPWVRTAEGWTTGPDFLGLQPISAEGARSLDLAPCPSARDGHYAVTWRNGCPSFPLSQTDLPLTLYVKPKRPPLSVIDRKVQQKGFICRNISAAKQQF